MLLNKLEKLRRENRKMLINVDDEERTRIKNMIYYASSKGMGMLECEIFRKDLIGMAQDAALRGGDLQQTLGTSEREFCDEVLNDTQKYRGELLLYSAYLASMVMLILYTVIFYSNYANEFIPYDPIYNITPLDISMPFVFMFIFYFGTYFNRIFIYNGPCRWLVTRIPNIIILIVHIIIISRPGDSPFANLPVLFTIQWPVYLTINAIAFIALRLMWSAYINRKARRLTSS